MLMEFSDTDLKCFEDCGCESNNWWPITFIIRLMNSIIENLEVKSTLYKSLKDTKLKITLTCFGSYAIHHQGVQSCA
jgi:hypothetical protein